MRAVPPEAARRRRLTAGFVPYAGALILWTTLLVIASSPAGAASGSVVTRLGGIDRFATAAEVTKLTFTTADEVLLVRGDLFADRATAGLVAGRKTPAVPVLLTEPNRLPDSTIAALARLRPARVRIVGGRDAVSDGVAGQLRARGYDVSRLGGRDRADTARLAAHGAAGIDDHGLRTAVVVDWSDPEAAAVASPMVFAAHFPLVFATDQLPSTSADALRASGAQHVLVVGAAAGRDGLITQLRSVRGVSTVDRLGGGSGAESADVVASWTMQHLGFASSTVVLAASGTLDGMILDAQPHRAQVLVVPVSSAGALDRDSCALLRRWGPKLRSIQVLGGTDAVPDRVASGAASCAGADDTQVHPSLGP
jgi:hypothetical protein